jgi:hypothetical protein
MIPATAYFLNSLLRLSLIVFGKNCPKYGFMAAKTFRIVEDLILHHQILILILLLDKLLGIIDS